MKKFLSVLASTVALASLCACSTTPDTQRGAEDLPEWSSLSESQKNLMIDSSRGQGMTFLIYKDQVIWHHDPGYPDHQKQWIEDKVAEYADSDAPVSFATGLGGRDEDLTVYRSHNLESRFEGEPVHYDAPPVH